MSNKKEYEPVRIEIIRMGNEDVITCSIGEGDNARDDNINWGGF